MPRTPLVGGQIGYRWRVANWVFGIEGQGNWADFHRPKPGVFFTDEPWGAATSTLTGLFRLDYRFGGPVTAKY